MIIPDSHAKDGVPSDRFKWAGALAVRRKPPVIVNLGDLADMESLCSYDRGRKDFEGRRYKKDIAAVHEALEAFETPIRKYNEQQKRNRKLQYKPRKVLVLGNHEDRISRATQIHPELEGAIGLHDLKYKDFGWEVLPYNIPIEIDGVWYCHTFPSGVRGEPISGMNVAASLLAKLMTSCTVGHNHLFDYAIRALPSGQKVHGLSAGCFLDENQHEKYAAAVEYLWARGLVYKHNVSKGQYDLEFISLSRLENLYEEGNINDGS